MVAMVVATRILADFFQPETAEQLRRHLHEMGTFQRTSVSMEAWFLAAYACTTLRVATASLMSAGSVSFCRTD